MKRTWQNLMAWAIACIFALTMVPTAHAATYDYAVEGGNLKFDPTTGTITDCDLSVYSADIPSEIYGVPVIGIGEKAFASCSKLASVTIPSTVTKIEKGAFWGCKQLTSITIPSSVTTLENSTNEFNGIFNQCYALESITISGNVKRIPNYIFKNCTSLKNVTLER